MFLKFQALLIFLSLTATAQVSTRHRENSSTFNRDAFHPKFNPVVGISARTLSPGHFAFQRAPIYNINSSFLLNSVTLSIIDRFEVGTTPSYYFSTKSPSYLNYMLKFNFYSSEYSDWTLSYAENRLKQNFTTAIGETGETGVYKINLNSVQLATNFYPDFMNVDLGFFVSSICASSQILFKEQDQLGSACKFEYGADAQWPLQSNQWITFGSALLRENGFTPFEEKAIGVGAAYSIYRPGSLISRPSLSYYATSVGNGFWTFSTTVYED